MPVPRRSVLAMGAALPLAAAPTQQAAAAPGAGRPSGPPLANLAHLDFLRDEVRPAPVPGHTTYRLREEPALGVLWTYAERRQDGSYERVGGGSPDPDTGHYEQGAYNADDIARAAVVYLRHHGLTGDTASLRTARELLRGLCYLQTTTGPHAGNVVLWQQADGTLNRSALPPETPDPSDSAPSYWLARLLWALGEAYGLFRRREPAFAAFLRDRIGLALDALERDVLARYGEWEQADGHRVPAWLIVHGADASAEALLGLTAYVRAGGGRRAERAAGRLAEGIAALQSGGTGRWPYGALLPTATSVSQWHAWGAQMPTALAEASRPLGRPELLRAALADAAGLTPQLLTAGGCDNGWLPAPVDRSQIAYGVDARLQALLAVARHSGATGLYPLAALTAAWYFGANAAGEAVYDPHTGVTFDGVSPDGEVNRNSGAESAIHGQLSMLALDGLARRLPVAPARLRHVADRDGPRTLEAEKAEPAGAARVVRPDSAWTGESQYGGGAYVRLADGGGLTWRLPDGDLPLLLSPVVRLVDGPSAGTTVWHGGKRELGRVDHGAGGPQGISPAPGALLPVPLAAAARPGERLHARASGVRDALQVDGVLVQPVVSRLVLTGPDGPLALLHNGDGAAHTVALRMPGVSGAVVDLYDEHARHAGRREGDGTGSGELRVSVPARWFAVARRG